MTNNRLNPAQGSLNTALSRRRPPRGAWGLVALAGATILLLNRAGPSGQIAYSSDEPGSHDVFVLDIGCALNPTTCPDFVTGRLTDHGADDVEPHWSYDGTRLVFVSDRDGDADIYLVDNLGCAAPPGACEGQLINLTDNEAQDGGPVFSHACAGGGPHCVEWIAFGSDRAGSWDLYMMRADGSQVTRLTDYYPAEEWWPTWSPDGKKLAFMSNLDGRLQDIYLLDLASGAIRNLTQTPEYDEVFPAWSPDGRLIAFSSDRTGWFRIYTMDAGGNQLRRVTPDAEAHDFEPAWSPDGQWLAFESYRDGEADFELFIIRPDGSGLRQLTDNEYIDDLGPAWKP